MSHGSSRVAVKERAVEKKTMIYNRQQEEDTSVQLSKQMRTCAKNKGIKQKSSR